MANTPVEPTAAEVEAKRRMAERLFEKDGCGLLIVRQDGTVQLAPAASSSPLTLGSSRGVSAGLARLEALLK